jgi:hypothetical protein
MNHLLTALASPLGRLGADLDDLIHAGSLGERPLRLATLLKPLAPAGLAACQLTEDRTPALAWCADTWQPPPELAQWLSDGLAGLDPCSNGVLRLPDLERQVKVRSQVAALARDGRPWGFLILAQPPDVAADWLALTDSLLLLFAHVVGLHWRLQREMAHSSALAEQAAETARTVLQGDSVLALTHDLNNHLNRMMLQTAVVQMKLNGQHDEELTVVRHEIRAAAALVRPLQQSWQEQRLHSRKVDLNVLLREVLDEAIDSGRLELELGGDLPAVPSLNGGLRRLLRLLLLTTVSRQPASQPARARTWTANNRVGLTLEDAGEPLSAGGFTEPFDAEEGPFAGRPLLERLAIQSLLRAAQASLEAAPRPGGGLLLTVSWS